MITFSQNKEKKTKEILSNLIILIEQRKGAYNHFTFHNFE